RHRRLEGGAANNERYGRAVAAAEEATRLGESACELGRPRTWKGRSVRALNPLAAADVALLEAVNRGEVLLNGFRNRDLRAVLFPAAAPASPEAATRQSARVTRLIRLLRAHGVIAKVAKTHRYQVTAAGPRPGSTLPGGPQA